MKSVFWVYHECLDMGPGKEYHGVVTVSGDCDSSKFEVEVTLENNKASDEVLIGRVVVDNDDHEAAKKYALTLLQNDKYCKFMWKKHKKERRNG